MIYPVLDFETFYDTKSRYSLKNRGKDSMSIPEYIGSTKFKVHCLGVELDGKKKVIWGDGPIQQWIDGWRKYDGDYAFVMHNAFFDAAILKWHYKFTPALMLDTLLMANHVLGSAKDSGNKNDLASLAIRLGLSAKGRLDFMDGVVNPDAQQRALLEVYLAGGADDPEGGDLGITRKVFNILLPHITNPDMELWLIDHTLKIYADKPLLLNMDTVARAERLIEERRDAAAARLIKTGAIPTELSSKDKLRGLLSSNKEFETILHGTMKTYGMKPPMKTRPLTKPELVKFEKLKTAAELGPDERIKFHDYLTKLQNQSVDVWEEKGIITIGKTKQVPALAKKDEQFIKLSFSQFEGVSALVTARLVERSAITSAARIAKMRRVASGLQVMPVQLVYYGAHTGRSAGGGGFNFQNLTNPDRAKDPGQKEIATAIRDSFEAPPGFSFIAGDLAQVEARVSAWIAGQWDLLDQFRTGADVYSLFISNVLGEEITKPKGDESPERAAHLKLMRHIGKEAVLALSYQMWKTKFVARLREDPDVARMFESGKLTEEFCGDVVEKYRDKHTAIIDTWAEINNAFFIAKAGGVKTVGPLTFRRGTALGSKLPVVTMELPSGRKIYYRDIRQDTVKSGKFGKEWKHGGGQRVYGGLLLENATQAVARDLLMEDLVSAELDRGIPINLNVHDSLVGLVPDENAKADYDWLLRKMSTNPVWADDRLILSAEGKLGKTLVT